MDYIEHKFSIISNSQRSRIMSSCPPSMNNKIMGVRLSLATWLGSNPIFKKLSIMLCTLIVLSNSSLKDWYSPPFSINPNWVANSKLKWLGRREIQAPRPCWLHFSRKWSKIISLARIKMEMEADKVDMKLERNNKLVLLWSYLIWSITDKKKTKLNSCNTRVSPW